MTAQCELLPLAIFHYRVNIKSARGGECAEVRGKVNNVFLSNFTPLSFQSLGNKLVTGSCFFSYREIYSSYLQIIKKNPKQINKYRNTSVLIIK